MWILPLWQSNRSDLSKMSLWFLLFLLPSLFLTACKINNGKFWMGIVRSKYSSTCERDYFNVCNYSFLSPNHWHSVWWNIMPVVVKDTTVFFFVILPERMSDCWGGNTNCKSLALQENINSIPSIDRSKQSPE